MKNKKGFTLIELLVSFALITIVSVSLFRTVLAVQKKAQKDIAYNQYIAFAATFNNAIELDFTNNTILSVAPCGQNCFDIIYSDSGTKRFSIDRNNNSVMYGTIKEKIPAYYEFGGDIKIELDTAYNAPSNVYNSVAKLIIPLKSSLLSFNQDLKYVYQYDSRVNDIAQTLYTTLTINPLGGKYDGSTVSKVYNILPGQTINILDPTDKDGNVFEKWNFSGSGTFSNGVFTASTGDAVLTAGWLTYANMYTYLNGTSQLIDDGNGNWRIKLMTDGIFSFKIDMAIDVFVLGGGKPGATSNEYPGGVGGKGGGCSSGTANLTALTSYNVDIGESNLNSTAFSLTGTSGDGASGGAGGHWYYNYPGATGGTGTCYAFGDATIKYGAGGGGGGSRGDNTDYELGGAGGTLGGGHGGDKNGNGVSGTTNTGGGGGGGGSGGYGGVAGIGGSGIVIIRNQR